MDSACFLTSLPATSRTSSSESSWRTSFSRFVTAAESMRRAPRRTLSLDRNAVVISSRSCSFSVVATRRLLPHASPRRAARDGGRGVRRLWHRDRTLVVPAPPLRPGHPATGRATTTGRAAPVGSPFPADRYEEGTIPRVAPTRRRPRLHRRLPRGTRSGRNGRGRGPHGPRRLRLLVRARLQRPLPAQAPELLRLLPQAEEAPPGSAGSGGCVDPRTRLGRVDRSHERPRPRRRGRAAAR